MDRPTPSRRSILTGSVAAGAVLALTGIAAGPRPSRLGAGQGDQALLAALEPHLGGHHRVAAVVFDDESPSDDSPSGDSASTVRYAGFGADENTEFELGSVGKTFTGALLMDAIDRGEVTLETMVAEILGDRAAGSETADVTLAELASHASGLPRLPLSRTVAALPGMVLRRDPYAGVSPEGLIEAALGASTGGRGQYEYSNLGYAFLGHLLATRAETPWHDLLGERLLDPLGMSATYAPQGPGDLAPEAPTGRTTSGLSAEAWTSPGYGPAGSIRSSAADMAIYLRSLRDGSNPGAAGLDPLLERDEDRAVAVTWGLRSSGAGERVISHNGMTGGFAAYCGWNPDNGRAIALMTATELGLDDLGAGYLEGSIEL